MMKIPMENVTLSIVIPCYNEKKSIRAIVDKVREAPVANKEIIVVDDCSTDGTGSMLDSEIAPLVSKVIHQKQNGGKGAALRTGFAAATGDIVIIQDADMEYDPNEYVQVIEPICRGEADVVYGSRFAAGRRYETAYRQNIAANLFLTRLSNLFTGLRLTDMETCYKAFRREIIQAIEIQENRFGFEPEITAKIAAKKVRIAEVPISYYPRKVEEGKKINWKDGVRAIYCIVKYH